MPIIKHSAVHITPLKAIKYVINGDKTDHCKYVSGINVGTNADEAYEDFRINFEMHTGERFFKAALPENGKKERIRLHHYIQSFKSGEVTPEQAHKIGEEWVWAMFRKKWDIRYQVLICTHVDKACIHNHIIISAVDLDGNVWHDNKETLKKAREQSDKIAKKYGLSIIENPKKRTMLPYSEYIARQDNRSWKEKLKSQIDMLVLSPDVKNVNDLAEKLKVLGYEISGRKYMHIKRAKDKNRKPMSTLKLGDGYGLEELQNRIEWKNVIMPLAKVNSYSGIQREYAFCLREMQFLMYRKQKTDYAATYESIRKSSEVLLYISKNDIHSVSEFEKAVNSTDEKFHKLSEEKKELEEKIKSAEKVFTLDTDDFFERSSGRLLPKDIKELSEEYRPMFDNRISNNEQLSEFRRKYERMMSEVSELEAKIEKARAERNEAAKNYKTYLEQRETDYDRMLREMKEFYEFNESGLTETYKVELSDMHYFAEIYKGSVTEKTRVDYDRMERNYDIRHNIRSQDNNYRSYGYER